MSDVEDLKKAADELEEELRFVSDYLGGRLNLEAVRVIEEAQKEGRAKTVGEAFDLAKKSGWK